MIVREIENERYLLEDFDWFNDYKDTRNYLVEIKSDLLEKFDEFYNIWLEKTGRTKIDLIAQYKELHKKSPGYGRAATYLSRIIRSLTYSDCHTVIDYGCGKGLLADKLNEAGFDCIKFDPAIEAFSKHPDSPVDAVVCNDVMEHLTHETVLEVLEEIGFLAIKGIFFNISCRPAVHTLPNGMNCHTLILTKDEWLEKIKIRLERYGFSITKHEYFENNSNLIVCLGKSSYGKFAFGNK